MGVQFCYLGRLTLLPWASSSATFGGRHCCPGASSSATFGGRRCYQPWPALLPEHICYSSSAMAAPQLQVMAAWGACCHRFRGVATLGVELRYLGHPVQLPWATSSAACLERRALSALGGVAASRAWRCCMADDGAATGGRRAGRRRCLRLLVRRRCCEGRGTCCEYPVAAASWRRSILSGGGASSQGVELPRRRRS
jgi:hypothetical protein